MLAATAAPQRKKQRPKTDERVFLIHSDELKYDRYSDRPDAQIVKGKVHFSHAGAQLWCDSAYFFQDANSVEAFGHVRFKQGDTLSLTCDRADYDGGAQMMHARHNVVLRHRQQTLYTDSLDYDRIYSNAYFFEGGKLIDGKDRLVSDWGEYNTVTRQASFFYNVQMQSDKNHVSTDTLHYDTQSKWAEVTGQSNIYTDNDRIYTEHGFYNTETERVRLFEGTKAFGRDRVMAGDTVYYDKLTGVMEAFGNVSCEDTRNKNILTSDYAWYNEKTGEALATKRALARDYSRGTDTLYVHGDTLRLYTYNIETDSVYRVLHGYFHVRAYRSDMQAVADSLVFTTQGNRLTLYRDPIVWSDGRQIVGEEINVFMNDSTIDSAHVDRQALMVERLDSLHYNQVASQRMRSYYVNGEMSENRAIGNVRVVNYPLEKDSAIVQQNYIETSKARMFMAERKLRRIWAPAGKGTLYPAGTAPAERTQLEGFAWFDYIRPTGPDDVFVWRPKRRGSEL